LTKVFICYPNNREQFSEVEAIIDRVESNGKIHPIKITVKSNSTYCFDVGEHLESSILISQAYFWVRVSCAHATLFGYTLMLGRHTKSVGIQHMWGA
jgi:hypothetical protein